MDLMRQGFTALGVHFTKAICMQCLHSASRFINDCSSQIGTGTMWSFCMVFVLRLQKWANTVEACCQFVGIISTICLSNSDVNSSNLQLSILQSTPPGICARIYLFQFSFYFAQWWSLHDLFSHLRPLYLLFSISTASALVECCFF